VIAGFDVGASKGVERHSGSSLAVASGGVIAGFDGGASNGEERHSGSVAAGASWCSSVEGAS
jgi:hypothetical protein